MKLDCSNPSLYRVKQGQTLLEIALNFHVLPRALAVCNALSQEPLPGQILKIPQESGNFYLVKGGESKSLLCGSVENFQKKNYTACFYPAQLVLL